jgi:hypothetical protein
LYRCAPIMIIWMSVHDKRENCAQRSDATWRRKRVFLVGGVSPRAFRHTAGQVAADARLTMLLGVED